MERETARPIIGATGGVGVDAVIDTVGEPTWDLSLKAVRAGRDGGRARRDRRSEPAGAAQPDLLPEHHRRRDDDGDARRAAPARRSLRHRRAPPADRLDPCARRRGDGVRARWRAATCAARSSSRSERGRFDGNDLVAGVDGATERCYGCAASPVHETAAYRVSSNRCSDGALFSFPGCGDGLRRLDRTGACLTRRSSLEDNQHVVAYWAREPSILRFCA